MDTHNTTHKVGHVQKNCHTQLEKRDKSLYSYLKLAGAENQTYQTK